ncbi:MAG: TadE/TadG family type IV pilus assembly protein [Marmoricola sp.]
MSTWGSRKRDDRGAAVVETALCICFVVLPLVFGTIAYAYMLSFRQTVTQAAAEGARAGAVAPTGTTDANRTAAAMKAVSGAMATGPGALACNDAATYLVCTAPVATCTDGSGKSCITVTVTYPYRDHSLLPSMPGLGFLLPKNITYAAVAQVN